MLWARVWAKATIPDDPDACILWTGALSLKRHGTRRPVIRDGHRVVAVTRVVCTWFHGPSPTARHHAGHTCPVGENRLCINPRHLEWQSPEENVSWRSAR